MYKEKGELQSIVDKLKATHGSTLKTLQDTQWKLASLTEVYNDLEGRNKGLDKSLQWSIKQYKDMLVRFKDVETNCNLAKCNAIEECKRMVNENKKKQWCAVCQKSGGRYYCSDECEESNWYVLDKC